jgi:hypothetical protein
MEAARNSETSVAIQLRTRQYIPEDSELHTLNVLTMTRIERTRIQRTLVIFQLLIWKTPVKYL